MKSLRKECIRCKALIQPKHISEKDLVYTCSECDSVASIFEDRDFIRNEKKERQPAGIRQESLGGRLYIYMDQLPSGEMLRSVVGTGLILVFFLGIFYLTDSMIFYWVTFILGGVGWVINFFFYLRVESRTYEIELSPYKVVLSEKLFGFKIKLKEVDSFAVDRIQLLTQANPGVPGKNKTDFIIQTKQYLQIKPFFHSSGKEEELNYLKFLMDTYLGILPRVSDVEK